MPTHYRKNKFHRGMDSVLIQVDAEVKRIFKAYCARHGWAMGAKLESIMRKIIDKDLERKGGLVLCKEPILKSDPSRRRKAHGGPWASYHKKGMFLEDSYDQKCIYHQGKDGEYWKVSWTVTRFFHDKLFPKRYVSRVNEKKATKFCKHWSLELPRESEESE